MQKCWILDNPGKNENIFDLIWWCSSLRLALDNYLVHAEVADFEAISTPSVLSWAAYTFSRVLKVTNFVHSLHGHS